MQNRQFQPNCQLKDFTHGYPHFLRKGELNISSPFAMPLIIQNHPPFTVKFLESLGGDILLKVDSHQPLDVLIGGSLDREALLPQDFFNAV